MPLWDNVKKYGAARQDTDYNTIIHMHFTWLTKATDTHSEYVKLVTFPRHQWLCMCLDVTFTHIWPLLWAFYDVIQMVLLLSLMNMHYQKLMKFNQQWYYRKNRNGSDRAHSLYAAWTCHGHSFVIIYIHSKSILLEITHQINGAAQKYSLFILTGKCLHMLDILYGMSPP